MSTAAQISANQANAQKSTGPATEAGKAASSQNRRLHGLAGGSQFTVLPCEDQAGFDRLLANLTRDFDPRNTVEALLVQRMAEHEWLRSRAFHLQQTCFDPETGDLTDTKKFSLYLRYYTTHERGFHKCFNDLLKLRKEEQKLKIGFEREKREQELHPLRVMHKEMAITMLQIKESSAKLDKFQAEFRSPAA